MTENLIAFGGGAIFVALIAYVTRSTTIQPSDAAKLSEDEQAWEEDLSRKIHKLASKLPMEAQRRQKSGKF